MQTVTEAELRERFALAFELLPQLAPTEFYKILRSTGFDEKRTMIQIIKLRNNEGSKIPSDRYLTAEPMPASAASLPTEESASPKNSVTVISDSDSDDLQTAPPRNELVSSRDGPSEDTDLGWDLDSDEADLEPSTQYAARESGVNRHPETFFDRRDGLDDADQDTTSIKSDVSDNDISPFGTSRIHGSIPAKSKGKSTTPTTVTKWVQRLVGGLYVRTMITCDGEAALNDKDVVTTALSGEDTPLEALINVTGDPEARRAGWQGTAQTHNFRAEDEIWTNGHLSGYEHVMVDGVKINLGDFILVRPTQDRYKERKSKTEKSAPAEPAAKIWFARVEYILCDKYSKQPSAHVRWFDHGGDTILGEAAGPKEFFLTARCGDIDVSSIAGKINVQYLGRDVAGESGIGVVEERECFKTKNEYFYRLFYDEQQERFEEVESHDEPNRDSQHAGLNCNSCRLEELKEAQQITSISEQSYDGTIHKIVHHGQEYCVSDDVYIIPESSDEPYIIGKIMKIRDGGILRWTKINSSTDNDERALEIIVQPFRR